MSYPIIDLRKKLHSIVIYINNIVNPHWVSCPLSYVQPVQQQVRSYIIEKWLRMNFIVGKDGALSQSPLAEHQEQSTETKCRSSVASEPQSLHQNIPSLS